MRELPFHTHSQPLLPGLALSSPPTHTPGLQDPAGSALRQLPRTRTQKNSLSPRWG